MILVHQMHKELSNNLSFLLLLESSYPGQITQGIKLIFTMHMFTHNTKIYGPFDNFLTNDVE